MNHPLPRAKYSSTSGTPPTTTPFTVDREGALHWIDGLIYTWDAERKLYVCGEYRTVSFQDDQLGWISQYDPPPDPPPQHPGMTSTGTWLMAGPLDPVPD